MFAAGLPLLSRAPTSCSAAAQPSSSPSAACCASAAAASAACRAALPLPCAAPPPLPLPFAVPPLPRSVPPPPPPPGCLASLGASRIDTDSSICGCYPSPFTGCTPLPVPNLHRALLSTLSIQGSSPFLIHIQRAECRVLLAARGSISLVAVHGAGGNHASSPGPGVALRPVLLSRTQPYSLDPVLLRCRSYELTTGAIDATPRLQKFLETSGLKFQRLSQEVNMQLKHMYSPGSRSCTN